MNSDNNKDEKRPASRYGNCFAALLAAQDIAVTPERSVQQFYPPAQNIDGVIVFEKPRTEGAQVVHMNNDVDNNNHDINANLLKPQLGRPILIAAHGVNPTPDPKASEASVLTPYHNHDYSEPNPLDWTMQSR